MRKILVVNSKGGCGKTTLATNLAVALAARGDDVALADADRQKSSLSWVKRRPKKVSTGPRKIPSVTRPRIWTPSSLTDPAAFAPNWPRT